MAIGLEVKLTGLFLKFLKGQTIPYLNCFNTFATRIFTQEF